MSDIRFWLDAASVLLVLANFGLLGSARIGVAIRLVAVQAIALAFITLLGLSDDLTIRSTALAAATLVLKGGLFPWLLFRAQREAKVEREVTPFLGYQFSLVCGVVALAAAVWLSRRLTLPLLASSMVVPVGFFMIFVGLFIIVTRRTALVQVLGYLVLENGIAAFGLSIAGHEPLLVELGVLLDVFVAVFVMGIAIAHINREFDHIEVDQLAELRH